MSTRLPRARSRTALAALGALLLGGAAVAAVVPRDLTHQLELIGAQDDGLVVFGTITASAVADVPTTSGEPMPHTVLTVAVERALTSNGAPGVVTVYVPGAGEQRLSISPAEDEIRVGGQVLLFLRADARIRALAPQAYKLDSFAEVFRTQTNRKGRVVVLGEGNGSAVPANVELTALAPQVEKAYQAVKAAAKGAK